MIEFYSIQYLEKNNNYSTGLHLACINENLDTVRFFIEYAHCDPNIKLKKKAKKNLYKLPEGSTPLHAAAKSSSIEIFEYLLLHGADPFISNVDKNDAFDIAYQFGN